MSDLYSEESPNPLGLGHPTVLGGDAVEYARTLGEPRPGQLGRPHAYPSLAGTAFASVERSYAVTLEKENGERMSIERVLDSGFNPSREHTALSDWSLSVPYDPAELEEWTYGTRVWITWDGRVVWQGICTDVDSAEMDGESTLSGYGPGKLLDEGSHTIELQHVQVWRAFNRVFEEVAPDWTATATRPRNPAVIDDFEVSGTPLECIQQLADEYNWHFLVDQSRWKRIQAFKPGTFVESRSWKRIDSDREKATGGYYNAAEVTGGRNEDGERVTGYYEDEQEIERHAARRGISYEEARKVKPVDDPDIESRAEANAVARARAEEAIEQAEVTGSIEVFPRLIDPGKAYSTHWEEDRAVGAYSLAFDGEADVEIPVSVLRPLRESGGVSFYARAEWSALGDDEVRMLGSTRDGSGMSTEFRTEHASNLSLHVANGDGDSATVQAFPGGDESPADGEWLLLQYDWEYDADADETHLRAGHGGEMKHENTLPGKIAMPDESLWFGRGASDNHYTGFMDYIQFFNQPPSEAQYAGILNGNDVPARLIRARYDCNEGPNQTANLVHDSYGGRHGQINGMEWAGSPKILHTVDYSHGYGESSCTLHFQRDRSTAAQVERLKRNMRLLNRRRSRRGGGS